MAIQATFRSIYAHLLLHIKAEDYKIITGGKIQPVPAKLITFVDGQYVTSDKEEIDLIKKTRAFEKGKIFILEEALETANPVPEVPVLPTVPAAPPRQRTVRGPVSSKTLESEMGTKPRQEPVKVSEKGITECYCGVSFRDDFHGRRLRAHQLTHRKGMKGTTKGTKKGKKT